MKVTAAEAGQLVNRHERIVRGHIKRGDLPATKVGNSWQVDTSDLESVPGWHIDRTRLASLEERETRSVESLRSRVESLERELASLRSRVRALESSDSSARPFTTSAAHSLESTTGVIDRSGQAHQSESHPTRTYKDPLMYSDSLPGSARGNAKWVEAHGGPGSSWVREWPDVREWRSVEDAIAAVRRKHGWEGWQPT